MPKKGAGGTGRTQSDGRGTPKEEALAKAALKKRKERGGADARNKGEAGLGPMPRKGQSDIGGTGTWPFAVIFTYTEHHLRSAWIEMFRQDKGSGSASTSSKNNREWQDPAPDQPLNAAPGSGLSGSGGVGGREGAAEHDPPADEDLQEDIDNASENNSGPAAGRDSNAGSPGSRRQSAYAFVEITATSDDVEDDSAPATPGGGASSGAGDDDESIAVADTPTTGNVDGSVQFTAIGHAIWEYWVNCFGCGVLVREYCTAAVQVVFTIGKDDSTAEVKELSPEETADFLGRP